MPFKPHRFISVSTVEEVYEHKIFPIFPLPQGGCASSTQKCESLENLPGTLVGFGAKTVESRTLRDEYDTKTFCVVAQEGRAQPLHGLGTNPRLVGERQVVKSFGAL